MIRLKVLVMLPSYDAGGAENYALRLIEYAGTQDYEWHVTSGNPNNPGMEPKFEAAGAAVHYVSPGFGLTPRGQIWTGYFSKQLGADTVTPVRSSAAKRPLKLNAHRRCSAALRALWQLRLVGFP